MALNFGDHPTDRFSKVLDQVYEERQNKRKQQMEFAKTLIKEQSDLKKDREKRAWDVQKMKIKNQFDIEKNQSKQNEREKRLARAYDVNPDATVRGMGGFITGTSGEVQNPAGTTEILTQGLGLQPRSNASSISYKVPKYFDPNTYQYVEKPIDPVRRDLDKKEETYVKATENKDRNKDNKFSGSPSGMDQALRSTAFNLLINKGYSRDEANKLIEERMNGS